MLKICRKQYTFLLNKWYYHIHYFFLLQCGIFNANSCDGFKYKLRLTSRIHSQKRLLKYYIIKLFKESINSNGFIISDPSEGYYCYRMFSVYTNTKRLVTFNSNPNALECLDGIRSISMMWVIISHSFSTFTINMNFMDILTVRHFIF